MATLNTELPACGPVGDKPCPNHASNTGDWQRLLQVSRARLSCSLVDPTNSLTSGKLYQCEAVGIAGLIQKVRILLWRWCKLGAGFP